MTTPKSIIIQQSKCNILWLYPFIQHQILCFLRFTAQAAPSAWLNNAKKRVFCHFSAKQEAEKSPAIALSLLALFWLRHGWIAVEAKRKVGVLSNIALTLNLIAPIGLYVLALGLTDGGRRDEGLLLLIPGWLFFAGLTLMALGRGMGGLQPIKPLRGTGEMSFLIGETRGN